MLANLISRSKNLSRACMWPMPYLIPHTVTPPTSTIHVLPTRHMFQNTSSSFRGRRQEASASANTTEEPKPSPACTCYDPTLTLPNHFNIKMRARSASQANFGFWAGSRSCEFLPNMGASLDLSGACLSVLLWRAKS